MPRRIDRWQASRSLATTLLIALAACGDSVTGITAPAGDPLHTAPITSDVGSLEAAARDAWTKATPEDVAGMLGLLELLAPSENPGGADLILGNRVKLTVLERDPQGFARLLTIGPIASVGSLRADGSAQPVVGEDDEVRTFKSLLRRGLQPVTTIPAAQACSALEIAQTMGEVFFSYQGVMYGDPQALADFTIAIYELGACLIEAGADAAEGLAGQWADFKAGFEHWWRSVYNN